MGLINCTAHEVVFILPNGEELTIQPSGCVVLAQTKELPAGDVAGIPCITQELGRPQVIGESEEVVEQVEKALRGAGGEQVFIVSRLALESIKRYLPDSAANFTAPDTGPSALRENGQVKAVRRLVR